jgi:hypothetical protein
MHDAILTENICLRDLCTRDIETGIFRSGEKIIVVIGRNVLCGHEGVSEIGDALVVVIIGSENRRGFGQQGHPVLVNDFLQASIDALVVHPFVVSGGALESLVQHPALLGGGLVIVQVFFRKGIVDHRIVDDFTCREGIDVLYRGKRFFLDELLKSLVGGCKDRKVTCPSKDIPVSCLVHHRKVGGKLSLLFQHVIDVRLQPIGSCIVFIDFIFAGRKGAAEQDNQVDGWFQVPSHD